MYYMNTNDCYNLFCKNYIPPLIAFATCIHNNIDLFPNSIIIQYKCNAYHNNIIFITREGVVAYFLEVIKDLTCSSD